MAGQDNSSPNIQLEVEMDITLKDHITGAIQSSTVAKFNADHRSLGTFLQSQNKILTVVPYAIGIRTVQLPPVGSSSGPVEVVQLPPVKKRAPNPEDRKDRVRNKQSKKNWHAPLTLPPSDVLSQSKAICRLKTLKIVLQRLPKELELPTPGTSDTSNQQKKSGSGKKARRASVDISNGNVFTLGRTRSSSRANSEMGGYRMYDEERSAEDDVINPKTQQSKSKTRKSHNAPGGKQKHFPGPSTKPSKSKAQLTGPAKKEKATESQSSSREKQDLFENNEFFLTDCVGDGNYSKVMATGNYDKNEIRDIIEGHGGKVIDKLGSEHGAASNGHIFVVCNGYSQSLEYLYGVASGFFCVPHTWIKKCVHNPHKFTEVRVLPAGWSRSEGKRIEHHVEKPLTGKTLYFRGDKVWKKVLQATTAKVLGPLIEGSVIIPPKTDYVIVQGESQLYDKLELEARKKCVPIVTIDWAIEAIITGRLPNTEDYSYVKRQTASSDHCDGSDEEGSGNDEHSYAPKFYVNDVANDADNDTDSS